MAYVQVQQGTATWLPFVAANVNTGDPRTGITFNQVNVAYKKYTQSTFQTKVLAPGDFRENGNGVYEILFASGELDTLGTFIYVVNGNGVLPLPAIRQAVGQAFVVSSSSYTPGTITLDTNVLTGNLVDMKGQPLIGVAVSARIVAMPEILGSSPNIGGVSSDLMSVQTDAAGFFALEVLQGAVVDISIPRINYRRTLTVPANSTDVLFSLP